MAIKIFIPVAIEIEDKSFLVEVREATPADMQEIEKISAVGESARQSVMKIYSELSEVNETMRINDGILGTTESLSERAKLWLEQRSLLKERKRLSALLKEQPQTIDFREAFKKRFDLLVRGENKTALEEEMKKYSISYKQVIEEIETLVGEAKKKK